MNRVETESMKSGTRFLNKLTAQLFQAADDKAAFLNCFEQPYLSQKALVWLKARPDAPIFETQAKPAWFPEYVDIVSGDAGPGQHELHQAGAYYVLDPSSVFEASVLSAIKTPIKIAIDYCAAPGGKSVLISALLKPEKLLANEVIKNRLSALRENVSRLKLPNTEISSAYADELNAAWSERADLVVVDAPCSGQSLLLKGIKNPGCFNPRVQNFNAQRQRKILAEISNLVAPGGYLAYMTCTYSLEENEETLAWFMKRFPQFTAQEAEVLEEYRSRHAELPCYRLFPQQNLGVGGFTALMRRTA